MPVQGSKYRSLLYIIPWLGFSTLAWYLACLRLEALDFHTRDYVYYTEFIIKLSQPSQYHYYSINPGGYNFLIRSTFDGCDGFYQWVHMEPIRFIQALIYSVTKSIPSVFFFNSLLVCSPVLGINRMVSKQSGFFVQIVWILLFISFPATMLAVGYDNRPSVFLGIGFYWIIFFYLKSENKILKFLSFLFLLLVREEAIILNAVVCLYVFIQFINKKYTFKFFIAHFLTWLFYTIGVLKYFQYWNYHLFESSAPNFTLLSLILGGGAGLLLLLYIFIKRKYDHLFFLPIVIFIAQLMSLYQYKRLPDDSFQWYNDPRWMLVWPIVMAYMLNFKKNIFTPYIIASLTIFFTVIFLIGNGGIIKRIDNWETAIIKNKELFNLKKDLPINTRILTDYTTLQCFVGHNQLFCIDRLPCYSSENKFRFYPGNKEGVQELIEGGSYIVVTTSTANNILPWVQEKGFAWNIDPKNNFQIIQLPKN